MLDCGQDPSTMKISLLTALHFAARASDEVKSTIQNRFAKAGFFTEGNSTTSEDCYVIEVPEYGQLSETASSQDYVEIDSEIVTTEIQSVEDIVDSHINDTHETGVEEMKIPTTKDALMALQTLRNYVSNVEDSDSVFHNLYTLERQVMTLNSQKSKQKISDYFVQK
ncbi:hypothetical protein PR048_018222 [Dryococelus australis]|uniref:Uncharacterized protein n=1 Tax=Dryococelus australis TaxID=614101 RepID=A0ABQ9HC21_9NEOP|nr:hypothetical protein PR048_018222 [Dryococelus australis]